MTSVVRYLVAGALLGHIACGLKTEDPKVVSVRGRAEALLTALRQRDWGKAASFVLLDDDTRRRMGIPHGADPRTVQDQAAAWFERLYGTVAPGGVRSVVISEQDPNIARVTYRHGDLDAFIMRRVNGEWFYTLNDRDGTLR
jgi:hypothetical protein